MLLEQGFSVLAGMDEVGRGPLAGPLVVCCVVLPLDKTVDGVRDSKKLSAKKREYLFDKLMAVAKDCCTVFIDEKTVDEINVLNATKLAMSKAVQGLKTKVDCVLIDAVKLDEKTKTLSIIKGDDKSYLIAAASIIAKVTRDRYMVEQSKNYPQYRFEQNKGYGTKEHISALKKYGTCPLHRNTFLKNILDNVA